MITVQDITKIKIGELFHNKLKVKKVGNEVYTVIGYNYGDEEEKFTGSAGDAAEYINGYLGLRK